MITSSSPAFSDALLPADRGYVLGNVEAGIEIGQAGRGSGCRSGYSEDWVRQPSYLAGCRKPGSRTMRRIVLVALAWGRPGLPNSIVARGKTRKQQFFVSRLFELYICLTS